MDSIGRKDPEGYYIAVIPKDSVKLVDEFKNELEIIEVSSDKILIRTKSRGVILRILRKVS